MNYKKFDLFFFFLLRDHLPVGAVEEIMQMVDEGMEKEINFTVNAEKIFSLAKTFTNRFD